MDAQASEIRTGDTIVDPNSGVLCGVESVEPPSEHGTVALHMRGSVSRSYMGLVCKVGRVLRRAPRREEAREPTWANDPGLPVSDKLDLCACGAKTRVGCIAACLKG